MEISVEGKAWTVLKVYEKKQREKDVFLCEDKLGIKECFQRCDFECEYQPRGKKKLTKDVIQQIEKEVAKKTPKQKIFEMFQDYHQSKVRAVIKVTRKRLGYSYHETFDGRFVGKRVLQYDLNGNLLNSYNSAAEASRATDTPHSTICKHSRLKMNGDKYIWRYEDDQFKREG